MGFTITGIFFLAWSSIMWFAWGIISFGKGKKNGEIKEYAKATIVGFTDQSTKGATPIVKFLVDDTEYTCTASCVNRNEYPQNTIINISFKRSRLRKGRIGGLVIIEIPQLMIKNEKVWKNFKIVFFVLAFISLVVALICLGMGIKKS